MQIPHRLHWMLLIISYDILRVLSREKRWYFQPSYHLDIVGYLDVDWADDPFDHWLTSGYYIFVDDNLRL